MRTIAHISDLHFGRTDPRIVEGIVADLNEKKPNLLIVSGDLTQRARVGQYTQARDFLAKLPKPQIVIPGNHDIPLFNLFRRFFLPLGRYCRFITTNLGPIYRDEEVFVIGVNTARRISARMNGFWKDGRIDPAQVEEICQRTQDLPPELFKIVVTHHPFIPPSKEYGPDCVYGAADALGAMQRCGIDLLLAGHLHMGYTGDAGVHYEVADCSILSVQAGTATSTRSREQRNAYNWLAVDGKAVTVEVRAWGGQRFSTFTTTRFARTNGVWEQQQ